MAEFTPKKIDLLSINNGRRFEVGDGVTPDAVNGPIEAAAWVQALATTQPNVENIDNVGLPSISIEMVDGLPRFKFENLKGANGTNGADGAISVQYVTNIDTILPWPDSRPTGNFIPGIPYIYPVYITMSGSHIALYQYDPTTDTMTFLEELRENVLYYVAEGEKKGIYYALPSVSHNKFYPATITDGDFKPLKQDVEILEEKTADIYVKTSSNTAKIENLTNILLDNEQMEIVKVSQAFTTRQTADGENISDNQNVFPKLIKGSTVKSANLIPFPYAGITNGQTKQGITFTIDDNGVITESGTATGEFIAVLLDMTVKAGDVFSFSSYNTNISPTTFRMSVTKYDSSGAVVGYSHETVSNKLNIQDGVVRIRVGINFKNGVTVNNEVFKPMFNDGDTLLPFRPYFSGLKNAYLQSVKSTGRNLFDANDSNIVNNARVAISTGGVYSNEGYAVSGFIPISTATNVVFSGTEVQTQSVYFAFYKKDKSFISGGYEPEGAVIDVPENAYYMRFDFLKTATNVMLNHGTTAQPYEPYVKDTFNLPETLELGEWDKYDPQTGILARWTGYATSEAGFTEEEIASYRDAIVSLDGKTLAYNLALPPRPIIYKMRSTHYKAWNGGSETQEQGATDNSADGAMCTITQEYFVKVGGATNEQTE